MPDWKMIVRERIACLELKGPAESDLVEELGQHLEDKYQELLSGGTDAPEAHRQTLTELDNLYPLQARLERTDVISESEPVFGEKTRGNLWGNLWRDLRHSFRGMRKNPVFVLFVILPLALGIGANTAVFTIFDTVILNPLPVPDSASLAVLNVTDAKDRAKSKAILPVSYADLRDYAANNQAFSALAGYTSPRIVTFGNNGTSERMFSEVVTGNYFSTLKLKPTLGRFFTPEEDGAPGAHPVTVMNYSTWRGRFGGERDIIGKTLRLNNTIFTVIGVAPPQFIGVNAVFGPDLWMPAAMAEQVFPTEMKGALTDRGRGFFEGVGRLKPGLKLKQADANILGVAVSLAREYPDTNADQSAIVRPVSDVVFGSSGSSSSTPILFGTAMLLVVVAIILLIACSNVANLLLARSVSRQREMAVRLAIGASRSRLLMQLLTENLVYALLGGIAGFTIGYPGLQFLWSKLIPVEVSANMIKPNLDLAIFVYALAISVLTGFLFGTVPALESSRASVGDALKEESHSAGRSKRKIRLANVLLAGQVALSFLLLVTASLFLRSIAKAYQIDPGFQTSNLAVFLTNPGQAGYSKPQTEAFYKNVRERVATMPGVRSVSWASNLPLWSRLVSGFQIEGREVRSRSESITAIVNTVDVDYFETAGVPLIQGREFRDADNEDSNPVAIVNEKMAHDYWPGGTALGHRIRLPGGSAMRQIVGIARTANYSSLGEPPQACVYLPRRQNYFDGMTLYVRTAGAPEQLMPAIQREMRILGPHIMINDVRTGRTIIDNGLFNAKVGVGLLAVFGLLALGLASVGLYGAMAYSVTQRQREIGVRMALGAARRNVLQLVLRQGMSLVVTGMLVGFGGVLLIAKLLRRMLYGLSASDPLSVAAAAFVLLAVALLACYLPARRASRVDPLVALRES